MEFDWKPLQSNPEVINEYLKGLGLDTFKHSVHDVIALQDWAFDQLPKPVLAIIFLYGCTDKQTQFSNQQSQKLDPTSVNPNIFFMKQFARNACGTIALIHSIFNNSECVIKEDSILDKLRKDWKGKNSKEIGHMFVQAKELSQCHVKAVQEGKTEITDSVSSHFIAFVPIENRLYELDGCKKCAVDLGECSGQTFLEQTKNVIQEYMSRDPQGLNFSIMAFCRNS